MTIHQVLYYPHPLLQTKAEPVDEVNNAIRQLVDDMLETMYEFHGGGLAALQIGIAKRIVVIDAYGDRKNVIVLINPEIIEMSGTFKSDEGCLSVPGVSAEVERARYVKVKALDRNGKAFEIESEGDYLSACLQHEIDHLNGVLYIDHLSKLKRDRLIRKMKKFLKLM